MALLTEIESRGHFLLHSNTALLVWASVCEDRAQLRNEFIISFSLETSCLLWRGTEFIFIAHLTADVK